MPFVLVSWTLFRSPDLWDKFDIDWILYKGDQLFKFIGHLEDLAQDFLVEDFSVNAEYLENKTGEIMLL